MAGNYLLDSTIVIRLLRNDSAVLNHYSTDATLFISSVVLGELYYGALICSKSEQEFLKIEQFCLGCDVMHIDHETSLQYGQIKHRLRLKGRPIPENDIWIAAHALQHGLTLVSLDHHFNDVEGLLLESW